MSERSTLRAIDGWASRSGLTVAWNPSIGHYSSGDYQFNNEERLVWLYTPKVSSWIVDVQKG